MNVAENATAVVLHAAGVSHERLRSVYGNATAAAAAVTTALSRLKDTADDAGLGTQAPACVARIPVVLPKQGRMRRHRHHRRRLNDSRSGVRRYRRCRH